MCSCYGCLTLFLCILCSYFLFFFFFQAEDGIRDLTVTGVQTCALPIYGGWFGVALVVMLFVHEMGHVLEIRRQGMRATAPIFIPFLGAAIFQRQHPTDALK